MLYFDTSFLVPLILPEATSDKIAKFVHGLSAGRLTVSHWIRVEFSSLLAREVRMGGMDGRAARKADAQFEAMVAECFVVLLPNADDFNLAKEYLGKHEAGLRAGDALHLAIATNHRADALLQPGQDDAQGREGSAAARERGNRHRQMIGNENSACVRVCLRVSHPEIS